VTSEQKVDRYGLLVDWIIHSYDRGVERQARNPSPRLEGETDGLRTLLHFVQGMEHTDLDGLRERFAEGPARSAPVEE
jgi:hypothetical protein